MGVILLSVCKFGHFDCEFEGDKCDLCFNDLHYHPKKIKKQGMAKRAAKANDRKGSGFEVVNHNKNQDLLTGATSRMTPNSGAGIVKGDEEIRGLMSIMEELKQQDKTLAKGKKTFSIQKEWLEKLNREANAANKEFWYLKFSYADDNKCYIAVEEDMVMSMVYTMSEDRKAKIRAELKAEVAERHRRLIEAENVKLLAEIELLKSKLKLQELEG
jgi:hypothetical protein